MQPLPVAPEPWTDRQGIAFAGAFCGFGIGLMEKHEQIVECPLIEHVILCEGFWEVVMSFPMVGQEFSYRYFEVIELLACGVEWKSDLRASSLMTVGNGS